MVLCLLYLIYLLLLTPLIMISEKYVGICGKALKPIMSYFSNRTQRVQIDNVLSDFANIICGVPQGSVLGPLKCWYIYDFVSDLCALHVSLVCTHNHPKLLIMI